MRTYGRSVLTWEFMTFALLIAVVLGFFYMQNQRKVYAELRTEHERVQEQYVKLKTVHNETLDTLVITGVLGFVAYLWLFGGVFYFGLHWLGFIPNDWRRILFFVLLVVGAVAVVLTVSFIPSLGVHFFGLAIPVGMVAALFIYLAVVTTLPAPAFRSRIFWVALGTAVLTVANLFRITGVLVLTSTDPSRFQFFHDLAIDFDLLVGGTLSLLAVRSLSLNPMGIKVFKPSGTKGGEENAKTAGG